MKGHVSLEISQIRKLESAIAFSCQKVTRNDATSLFSQDFWDPTASNPLPDGFYILFLTMKPDGRVVLDTFNYNGDTTTPKYYAWYESVLEGGVQSTYSETVGQQTKTLLGTGDTLYVSYMAGSQPYLGIPSFTGAFGTSYTTGAMYEGLILSPPLGEGAKLAYYNQLSQRAVTVGNGHAGIPLVDSDIDGGGDGTQYLYPCNSGRFLMRPTAEGNAITIFTPCIMIKSPFVY